MEIKWNIKRKSKPEMKVIVADSRWRRQRMIDNIKRDGVADVTVSERTKTSLSVTVSHANTTPGEPAYDEFTVSQVPSGCSDLSFVEKYFNNPFGPGRYNYYLRVSKKQNMEALKRYLTQVLVDLRLNIDTLTVNLNIIGVDALRETA